ncbi:MAG: hypothetical protein M3Z24_11075 [Chloroflexota bacterium]|nr:hypothetical protein [Chloroflexota bacterium]
MRIKHTLLFSLVILSLLLAACSGGGSSSDSPSTPSAPPRVNGFGTAANHVHAMLALRDHVLMLATHYGLFRSEDSGTSWKQVAAGQGQLMYGLMTYSLDVSSLNPQRMYVLTQVTNIHPAGILGLYTSADQGRTWKLVTKMADLNTNYIFLTTAGNTSPDEVFIYIVSRGAMGLLVSKDDGQHFSNAGTLPFGSISGLLAIPSAPGHLLAYGSDGAARSTDDGAHWQVIKNIQGGVLSMATPGVHEPIYASGDAGIFVSHDGGTSFTSMENSASYASLTVSPLQPQVLYGKTGTATFRSIDSGKTWTALPHIAGNLAVLVANPDNISKVYLSLSYPTALYSLSQNETAWQSITPQA